MFIKTCRDRMRTLLGALMIGALALTSGCFSGDVNVVINEDGSADLKTTLVSVPMLAEIVEQSKTAIIGTVILVIVLIGAGAFFILRKRKPEEEQQVLEDSPIDITPNDKN